MSHQNGAVSVDMNKRACLIQELGGEADACAHPCPISSPSQSPVCVNCDARPWTDCLVHDDALMHHITGMLLPVVIAMKWARQIELSLQARAEYQVAIK